MKLIKKLETRKSKAGKWVRFGLFQCPKCDGRVERVIHAHHKTCSQECGQSMHSATAGGKEERLYRTWSSMKQRCNNPNHKLFKSYGGRGITIYAEWHEYIPFKRWALANGYQSNLTIDRKDNDGNYEPNNCQWITNVENATKDNYKFAMNEAIEIRKIAQYYGKGFYAKIGRAYNVSSPCISNIANNKTYQEVLKCVKN